MLQIDDLIFRRTDCGDECKRAVQPLLLQNLSWRVGQENHDSPGGSSSRPFVRSTRESVERLIHAPPSGEAASTMKRPLLGLTPNDSVNFSPAALRHDSIRANEDHDLPGGSSSRRIVCRRIPERIDESELVTFYLDRSLVSDPERVMGGAGLLLCFPTPAQQLVCFASSKLLITFFEGSLQTFVLIT